MNNSEPIEHVKTADSTIYYERTGASSGMPLFMINGGPGFDHTYFHVSPVWESLGSSRPIVFYDQRGTGKSSVVEKGGQCTLADQLTDLEALQEHLEYDQIDILGHSWGGFLGMAYTARFPNKVHKLILVDSAAPKLADTLFLFKNIFPETVERQNAVAFAVEMGDEDAIQSDLTEYVTMLCYSAEKRDAWVAQADTTGYRHHVNQMLWQDAQRFNLNPELRKFRQPTLVITGRYDINVAPSVAYEIHQSIPNSRFKVFEQSGHIPWFEEPDGFTHVVDEFLSESQ
ncbi:MAG TPA: alpha/beta hydrolase [Anaerolineales bacterium]|nr:alpha/beta hydrolase [Anaerolineales bacterium]